MTYGKPPAAATSKEWAATANGENPMATKKPMTEKQDAKLDKKRGIKENSPKYMRQDAKAGVKPAKVIGKGKAY